MLSRSVLAVSVLDENSGQSAELLIFGLLGFVCFSTGFSRNLGLLLLGLLQVTVRHIGWHRFQPDPATMYGGAWASRVTAGGGA